MPVGDGRATRGPSGLRDREVGRYKIRLQIERASQGRLRFDPLPLLEQDRGA